MDWFHTVAASCQKNTFTENHNVYPPALLGAIRLFSNCSSLSQEAFANRNQNISSTTSACMLFVAANYIVANRIGWRVCRNQKQAITVGLIAACWPPLVFGIDRLNTILAIYAILMAAICASLEMRNLVQSEQGRLRIISLVAYDLCLSLVLTIIKPYMALPCAAWMLARKEINVYWRICELAAFLSLYMCANQLVFSAGIFSGDIWTWIDALRSFGSITDSSLSNIWNMNHYSLSVVSQEMVKNGASHTDFLSSATNPETLGIVSMVVFGFAQFGVSLYLVYCSVSLIKPIAPLAQDQEYSPGRNRPSCRTRPRLAMTYQTRRLAFLILVFASLSIFNPKWGMYSGVIWLPVIVLGYCYGEKRSRDVIAYTSFLYFALTCFPKYYSLVGMSAVLCAYSAMVIAAATLSRAVGANLSTSQASG